MSLESLIDIDYTAEIDRLPRQRGHQVLPVRPREEWITFHYAGTHAADRSRPAELRRILTEAQFHLRKNWGSTARPAYGDGLMYDLVVLSDGAIVRTRTRRQQLWHAGNTDANRASWSVHVLLGRGQDLTPAQRANCFRLFDALRAESGIARRNVVGHHEWPRGDGAPRPSSSYRLLSGQSECPGVMLHAHLAAYRALSDAPAVPPTPAPALGTYTADSPLLGRARGTIAQWRAALISRAVGYTPADIDLILGEYQRLGELLAVDWFLALSQCAHETGRLSSWWSQRPRRNPAGLGVTGDTLLLATGQRPPSPRSWARDGAIYREGLSFQAWRDQDAPDGEGSISHHLGRLLAYALPATTGTALQRQYIDRALALRPLPPAFRGIAPTLSGLNGRWAYPGRTYGKGLANLANVVLMIKVPA